MAFSFGFSGDDIDVDPDQHHPPAPQPPAETLPRNGSSSAAAASASAFPVAGKPQLPPKAHSLADMLAQLPSKIAYDLLEVDLDDGAKMRIPRRELWDVRVQLMAEDQAEAGGEGAEGLGSHDVKTGVYEGGFKSWESSVDLVKVLAADKTLFSAESSSPMRLIELGCGTALPSLALFRWAAKAAQSSPTVLCSFIVADYNPTVLQLVTLPNFILAWALDNTESDALKDAFSMEGELELTPDVIQAFQDFLGHRSIDIQFLSGGWSSEFSRLLEDVSPRHTMERRTLVLGAETIYSPFALRAFTETIINILDEETAKGATADPGSAYAIVGAKRLYFGVGGSLDDFVADVQQRGALTASLREETEGVRRGVVRVSLG